MEQFIILCCVWFVITGAVTLSQIIIYGVSLFPCLPRDYKRIYPNLNKFGAIILSILGFFIFWLAYICKAVKFLCTVTVSSIKE